MIIDTHPHIISDDTVKYPISPLGDKRSKWSEEKDHSTVEQYVDAMEKAGIDKAVIVHSSTTYGYDCSYLADSIAKHPGLLCGVGGVDFMADDAVDKLNYWHSERKLCSFRIFTSGSTFTEHATWVDDPKTFPAWEWAQKNRVPVVLQVKKAGYGMIHNVLREFPDLLLVLDHVGGAKATLEELPLAFEFAKYPGFYAKITTANFRNCIKEGKTTPQEFLRAVINAFGADRVTWGSNFPSTAGGLDENVKTMKDACSDLSDEEREAFFGLNAKRLYSL